MGEPTQDLAEFKPIGIRLGGTGFSPSSLPPVAGYFAGGVFETQDRAGQLAKRTPPDADRTGTTTRQVGGWKEISRR